MPTNRDIKLKAQEAMMKAKPTAVIVGLVYFLARWVMNYFDTQITGVKLTMDYDAYIAGDMESAFSYELPHITFAGGLISLALVLVGILLMFGFTFYCMEISRGHKAGIANLLDGFALWSKALCIYLLTFVIVSVLSVFLIVPGAIAFYSYSMAPMLLFDHTDWGVIQCLRMSREMMRGHKAELFRLHLSFVGWLLLCLIPAAAVYVSPYLMCSQAIFYNRISGYDSTLHPAGMNNTLDKEQ